MAALAVDLVDEGDDRDVAQPADLEELSGLALDALRRVDHHDGGIDGGQRAVGILGKILVARRVEQVEDQPVALEAHDRRGDGDAALALDRHPVGARAAPLAARAHRARHADRAALQEQLLRQRRLAGVGMRDDGEGAPAPPIGARPGIGIRQLGRSLAFGNQSLGHRQLSCNRSGEQAVRRLVPDFNEAPQIGTAQRF